VPQKANFLDFAARSAALADCLTDLPFPPKRDFASNGGIISEEKRGPGEVA
jgi:hypothetical protein